MTNADWRFSINWPFREEASSDFYAWTAPEAARCGNRIALYEGGRVNRSSFVAIGRMVTDSVRAHQGDKRHWGWVQWVLLEKPCSMGVVKKRVGYANLSGRHVSVEPKVFERLWAPTRGQPRGRIVCRPMGSRQRLPDHRPAADQPPFRREVAVPATPRGRDVRADP